MLPRSNIFQVCCIFIRSRLDRRPESNSLGQQFPKQTRKPARNPASERQRFRGPARGALLGLLVLAASAATLPAEELQTWSDLQYNVARSERFRWAVGGTLRFADTVGGLYDRRANTAIEYRAMGGLRFGVEYLYRSLDVENISVIENRLTAGVSYPLLRGSVEVVGTTLYERHFVELVPNFSRYRQRFELSGAGNGFSPWLHQDFTFRQGAGFVRSRSRIGLQWKSAGASLRAAYQFESISRGAAWAPRHAIVTEVSMDHPIWRFE